MQQHNYREEPNPGPQLATDAFNPSRSAPRAPNHTLTIGRIVHYRLDTGPSAGQYRPAIVARVWDPGNDASAVQLQVFTDAGNDDLMNVVWKTSVVHGSQPGQYLWPNEPKPS